MAASIKNYISRALYSRVDTRESNARAMPDVLNPQVLLVGSHFECVSMRKNQQRLIEDFLGGNADDLCQKDTAPSIGERTWIVRGK